MGLIFWVALGFVVLCFVALVAFLALLGASVSIPLDRDRCE